ncbi:MAG TPA: T9SS type A sorting domain-containing protein [Candidatus Cloacimonetes bacterium]|nr:T9SS type A sorting domain-containing protein [Candidatus Cloacimonadota bacterium]
MEVRVFLNSQSDYQTLHALKLNGDIYPNGEALLYLIPSELEMIKSTGLKYRIEREDLNEFSGKFWQSMDTTREAYHTYAEIVALADSLATAFPDICEKYIFGTSVQGRELGALKISDNVTLDENEAEVMFDGGIHGDEVGCSENCIRFARELCMDYGVDPNITNLVDNREIWIYYMVNPDGRVADSRYNSNGVDLNRDAGYMWDGWGGSSGAFSQVESQALRDATYSRQFVVHTTYHSGTEFISCPWSYRADQCPDFNHIIQLAGVYSTTSTYPNLDYGQGCTGMYPINGSTKDTNYGAAGAISWSMEISYSKHPPASQIQLYYQRNVPAMIAMIEYAGYGLEGVVTDINTGDPVAATVFINNYFPCYTDPAFGDYHKYVLPGTYDITIIANGYETQTINNVVVTANNATATDFQLQPSDEDAFYGYKFSASQIPDNNTGDEGNTPASLGEPDNINYSIGKDGWCIIDMQYPIVDGTFNDFTVYEGDGSPEGFDCYAGNSIDGPFYLVGSGSGTTEFDLSGSGLSEAQFIKIVDDGDGTQTAPDAGFDLDAISTEFIQGANLVIDNYYIDDSATGNNDGILDPGEQAELYIIVRNNGTEMATDIISLLSCSDQFINVTGQLDPYSNIAPGEMDTSSVIVSASGGTPNGHPAYFSLDLHCNNGAFSGMYDIIINIGSMPYEDFETGDFSSFNWQFGGSLDWTINSNAYQGVYCARSGAIGNNASTEMFVTMDVASGQITFFRKVSSESSYDFLQFYIDGSMQGQWSGQMDWSQESFSVTTGTHTFKWVYDKDTNTTGGSDCAWIDNISFPASNPDYPILYLTPTMFDFGQVFVGNDSTDQFIIKNVGGGTLAGTITTPDGFTVMETGSASPVSVLDYSLSSGESQEYDLVFSPTLAQIYDNQISVSVLPFQIENIDVYGEGIPQTGLDNPEFYNETKLLGNFPNPVGNATVISYQLRGSAQMQNVLIDIYNIHGDYVTTIKGEKGRAYFDTSQLGNGLYLYKLQYEGSTQIQKMILIK